ncbi:MAG: hypothetical protein KatS3mg091_374 [Patescibacteria group bacterium]|nr:MAG: hypothetical protein KatS3mg091_374 [Patescibacteria group bacterium]
MIINNDQRSAASRDQQIAEIIEIIDGIIINYQVEKVVLDTSGQQSKTTQIMYIFSGIQKAKVIYNLKRLLSEALSYLKTPIYAEIFENVTTNSKAAECLYIVIQFSLNIEPKNPIKATTIITVTITQIDKEQIKDLVERKRTFSN